MCLIITLKLLQKKINCDKIGVVLRKYALTINSRRGVAQLVARLSGGQEVASSSLVTPTNTIDKSH